MDMKRTLQIALILSILIGSGVHYAPAKEIALIPRKQVFGNPEKARARISPDGNQLAFLAPKDGVLNVWVATVGQ
ncbi:MAG: hypothetical protein KDB27_29755, partial [Planctomycetales bacterium]|nr:hypothetical protein [Planctomycetales bacterium]